MPIIEINLYDKFIECGAGVIAVTGVARYDYVKVIVSNNETSWAIGDIITGKANTVFDDRWYNHYCLIIGIVPSDNLHKLTLLF